MVHLLVDVLHDGLHLGGEAVSDQQQPRPAGGEVLAEALPEGGRVGDLSEGGDLLVGVEACAGAAALEGGA